MGIFDHLTNHAEELAETVGVPADQLRSIATSMREQDIYSSDEMAALRKVAIEHGLPAHVIESLLAKIVRTAKEAQAGQSS